MFPTLPFGPQNPTQPTLSSQLGFLGMNAPVQPMVPGATGLGPTVGAVPTATNPASVAVPAPAATMPTGTVPGATDAVVTPDVPTDATGDAAAGGGFFGKIGGLEGIGSIVNSLGGLAQIWGGLQGIKMAREQLAFSKDAYNTNLTNQTQSYNTELEDRARARASATGASAEKVDRYLKKHSL